MKQSFLFYAALIGCELTFVSSILSAFFPQAAGFLFVIAFVGAIVLGFPFVRMKFTSVQKLVDFRYGIFPKSPKTLQRIYSATLLFVVVTFFLQFFTPLAFGLWFWGILMGVYVRAAIFYWKNPISYPWDHQSQNSN